MGILSWWSGKEAPATKPKQSTEVKPTKSAEKTELSDMNGAMEVPRPLDVTVFEFGSAVASADKVTLAGYCTVSEELEPCRWEILPGSDSEAPQFRGSESFGATLFPLGLPEFYVGLFGILISEKTSSSMVASTCLQAACSGSSSLRAYPNRSHQCPLDQSFASDSFRCLGCPYFR